MERQSNGITLRRPTRIRDQERAPVGADLKGVMREKSRHEEHTLTFTADVSEAHRQRLMDLRDWYLPGCQV